MARIRSTHATQWNDDDFLDCSPFARLLALALRNFADDQGVFEWKPKQIKRNCLPADACDVVPLLKELVEHQQVRMFTAEGKDYGAIRNFRKWQRPKSPNSTYPLPDEIRKYVGLTSPDFGNGASSRETISEMDEADDGANSEKHRADVGGRRKEVGGKRGEEESSLRSDTPQAADLALDEPEPPASKPLRKPKAQPPKLPDWLPLDAWLAFAAMRKKIRAPMTDASAVLNLKKLDQFRAEGHDPAAVLNQSIENSWRGLWPIKPEQGHGSKPHGKNGSTAADRAIRVLAEMSGFVPDRADERGCDPDAADDDAPRLALVACGTAQEARPGSDAGANPGPARKADPALLDARSHRSADAFEIPGFLLRS